MIRAGLYFLARVTMITIAVHVQTGMIFEAQPSWLSCLQIAALLSFGSISFPGEHEDIGAGERRACFSAAIALLTVSAVAVLRR